jgi:hypothetical protein
MDKPAKSSQDATATRTPPPSGRGWSCSSLKALRRRIVKALQDLEKEEHPDKDALAKYRVLFYGYATAAGILRDEQLDGLVARLDALESRVSKKAKGERLGPGAPPEGGGYAKG